MVIDYKSIIVSSSASINNFFYFLVQAKLRLSRMRRSHSAARHVAGRVLVSLATPVNF